MTALAFVLGAIAGVIVALVASRWVIGRSVARARAAERRARTAERLAELGSMTRGLAHEIRNPLSTIALNAQLVGEGVEDLEAPEEEKRSLSRRAESLSREVERLRGILEDFLEFAGELRIDAAPADLNRVTDELVDFYLPQANAQGVRLRDDLAKTPLRCQIDTPHLKQAVLNLMLNATQAMGADESERERELILRTEQGVDTDRIPVARLHVIDTGPGIPEDKRDAIFRPYVTTKAAGTGLGLPTARRIIEAMGGRIDLHSEPGAGTDFTITFPLLDS